jgi:O-antigen ligase
MLLLWLLLGFPFRSWGGVNLVVGLPNLTVDRVFLAIPLVWVAVQLVLGMRQLVKPNLADACVILFLIVSFLSRVLYPGVITETQEGFNFVNEDLLPLVAYLLGRQLVRTEKQVFAIANVLQLTALVIAVWAITEQFLGYALLTGDSLSSVGPYGEMIRSSSGIGHPSGSGAALVMMLPFVLHSFAQGERRLSRILSLALVVLVSIAIYLTYIRAAWLTYGAILIVMALLYRRLRKLCATILLFGGVATIVFWQNIINSNVFIYKISDLSNLYGRLDIAEVQWKLFLANPFLGVGGSAWTIVEGLGGSSHNTLLNLLAEFGLVGCVLYLTPVVIALRKSLSAYMRLPEGGFCGRNLIVCLWCSALAFIVNALAIELRIYTIIMGLFWLVVALMMRVREINATTASAPGARIRLRTLAVGSLHAGRL